MFILSEHSFSLVKCSVADIVRLVSFRKRLCQYVSDGGKKIQGCGPFQLERNINSNISVELVHVMAVLMKRASIVIILPLGLFDGTEDHFREAMRRPKRKGCH